MKLIILKNQEFENSVIIQTKPSSLEPSMTEKLCTRSQAPEDTILTLVLFFHRDTGIIQNEKTHRLFKQIQSFLSL